MLFTVPIELFDAMKHYHVFQDFDTSTSKTLELDECDEQFEFEDAPTLFECQERGWNEYFYICYAKDPVEHPHGFLHRCVIHAIPRVLLDMFTGMIEHGESAPFTLNEYLRYVTFRIELASVEDNPDLCQGWREIKIDIGYIEQDIQEGNYL